MVFSRRTKSILLSWLVTLLFVTYVVLLLVGPFSWFGYLLLARISPCLIIWTWDKWQGNKAGSIGSYLLIPQVVTYISVIDFVSDFKYLFRIK